VEGRGTDPVPRTHLELLRLPERERVEERRSPARTRWEPSGERLPRTGRRFFDDLGAGEYVLVLDAGPAWERLEVPVGIAAGDVTEVRVRLGARAAPER
jgi:hypothetical protein